MKGKVKPGHVVVVRYEDRRAAGNAEMLSPTSAIVGMGSIKMWL